MLSSMPVASVELVVTTSDLMSTLPAVTTVTISVSGPTSKIARRLLS